MGLKGLVWLDTGEPARRRQQQALILSEAGGTTGGSVSRGGDGSIHNQVRKTTTGSSFTWSPCHLQNYAFRFIWLAECAQAHSTCSSRNVPQNDIGTAPSPHGATIFCDSMLYFLLCSWRSLYSGDISDGYLAIRGS